MHHAVDERRNYLSCRYRRTWETTGSNELALCRLIQEITDFPEPRCLVATDVCTSCCRAPWPDGNRMNSVVASVIYDRADQAMDSAPAEAGGDRLVQIKRSALDYLEVLPADPVSRILPARGTRPCWYLGEVLAPGAEPLTFQC